MSNKHAPFADYWQQQKALDGRHLRLAQTTYSAPRRGVPCKQARSFRRVVCPRNRTHLAHSWRYRPSPGQRHLRKGTVVRLRGGKHPGKRTRGLARVEARRHHSAYVAVKQAFVVMSVTRKSGSCRCGRFPRPCFRKQAKRPGGKYTRAL